MTCRGWLASVLACCALAPIESAFGADLQVQYPPARSQVIREIQQDWERSKALEAIAEGLLGRFDLPERLTFLGVECGQPNAFYQPARKAIVVCLDLVPSIVDGLRREQGRNADRATVQTMAVGAIAFAVAHEVGHALVHLLSLPVLGREEDAADQISAALLLREWGLPNQAYAGALWFFRKKPLFVTQRQYSDEHSLDAQRMANLACWMYGSDPRRFEWALRYARVTPERAARCPSEFQQLDRTARQLLGDRLK